jgi:NADP-dependent 3-hydroxy acid dehydrogenase YdfG
MTDLVGLVAVVTGGASGIGAATAALLSSRGARVVVVDRAAPPDARQTEVDPALDFVQADVGEYSDLERVRDFTLDLHGRIDVVVAGAGITVWGKLAESDPAPWAGVLRTNVLGVAHTLRATLPTMISQGSGHVVILASVSGRSTYVGEPIYIASKWALVGLGRAVRTELAGTGVRLTLVEPGIVDTPLVRNTPEGRAELAGVQALQPEDVAEAIVFAVTRPARVDVDEVMITPTDVTG